MLVRFLNHVEETFICLLLVVMTLLVFVEVILRFGFGHGVLWAEELTLMLSGWMVLIGTSYGIKVGSHIGIDMLVRLFPDPLRRAVALVAVAGGIVYCVLFLIGSVHYLDQVTMIDLTMEDVPIPFTEDERVPLWFAHSCLLIGFGLIMLRLFLLGWEIIQGRELGFRFADEAKETMEHLETQEKFGLVAEQRPGRREEGS